MDLQIRHFRDLTAGELYEILRARSEVFVLEQKCLYQDLDGADREAYHLWLADEDGIEAYLRVLGPGVRFPEASIGRVLSRKRRQGLASRLLDAGIRTAQEKFGASAIRIEAQTYARALYERAGFVRVSEEFLEDGIPHIEMLLPLTDTPQPTHRM